MFFSFSKELKYQFKPITPRLPYMYDPGKTHILSPYVGTVSNAHIVNNVDLINKLKNITINFPFTLVSFDVYQCAFGRFDLFYERLF